MKQRLLHLPPLLGMAAPAMAVPAPRAEPSPVPAATDDPHQRPADLAPPGAPGQATLHDIRGPVSLPEPPALLFWLLPALVLLILAALFFYHRKRAKKKPPPPLAHEIALAELERLRSLMNEGQALRYAEQLAELLRRYLEARFRIPSTRQTTREFLSHLGRRSSSGNNLDQHHERLRHCLEQCDLSKFAHFTPDRQNLASMEQAVRDFIMATGQPRPEPGKS
jgi:hypothetical protein